MQNYNCFLLNYIKYGENDAVLHCFTEELGFQSFFAKGIYTQKNKKKPYLFPLNLIRISISPKKSSSASFPSISKLELADQNSDFTDVRINSILFFVADFLNQILREEGCNSKVFNELIIFRKEISLGNIDSYIALIFKILVTSGVAPLLSKGEFLNHHSGTFTSSINHHNFDEDISEIWKNYLETENVYKIRFKRSARNSFLDSLMLYYKIHFPGFHIPNSLAILRAVFD